jgi:hypothetical protein
MDIPGRFSGACDIVLLVPLQSIKPFVPILDHRRRKGSMQSGEVPLRMDLPKVLSGIMKKPLFRFEVDTGTLRNADGPNDTETLQRVGKKGYEGMVNETS